MGCYDFFLDEQYCDKTIETYWLSTHCSPNIETKQWFKDQDIVLVFGHTGEIGSLCTAMNCTIDQALLVQLTFGISSDTGQFHNNDELTAFGLDAESE